MSPWTAFILVFVIVHDHRTCSATDLNPNEPSYFTNRAACYMAIKHYKSAIDDCQSAAHLQRASPQPKTLLRLARCQFALGRPSQALASIQGALAADSANADAIALRQKVNALQAHLDRYQQSVELGEWSLARLALENAEKMIDGSVPIEWRCWKIDIEIRRKRWDAATGAARCVSPRQLNVPFIMNADSSLS